MLVLLIIGGFILAIILVFLVQAFNQGILTPEQIEKYLGLAVIGMIPLVKKKDVHEYILKKPQSSFAEAFNTLKTSLILSNPDETVKVLQFTSSIPQEGKSTLSIAFARLLAKAGNKVILLDSDLRRGSVQRKLGFSTTTSKGLTDLVMNSGGSIEEFVIKDEKSGAYIMPCGEAELVNVTDIFSSHRMHTIIDLLKKNFDYVILDTPPVMAVSDARIIAKLVDKTLFVVQWDKTPRKVIRTAVDILKGGGADIAGCVLNKVDLQRYASSLSHGGSGYYYQHALYDNYYTN
jgi:capsular exopolysaccharide synthesis family protein